MRQPVNTALQMRTQGADRLVERGLFIVVFPIRSATMVVVVLVQPSHFRE
jgi:hypothetical protein